MYRISGAGFNEANLIENSPSIINIQETTPRKIYVCHYETQWYLWIINYVSVEINDVNNKFLHSKKPKSKLFLAS